MSNGGMPPRICTVANGKDHGYIHRVVLAEHIVHRTAQEEFVVLHPRERAAFALVRQTVYDHSHAFLRRNRRSDQRFGLNPSSYAHTGQNEELTTGL
jgi:hypothetical protein